MEMSLEHKISLNKLLRNYEGNNSFLVSLQKQLKSKKTNKIDFNGKSIKVLSDKQYQAAESILK